MPVNLNEVENKVSGAADEKCTMKQSGSTLLLDAVTHFQCWEDLAAYYKVDLDVWEPESIVTNTWQVGSVDDHGFKVQPLMQIKVRFKKRENVAKAKEVMEDLIADMLQKAPAVKRAPVHHSRRRKKGSGVTLEISLPDPHYGLLAWGREAGIDWDSSICSKVYMNAVTDILERAAGSNRIDNILFVTGNDFFNVNSMLNTTAKGTPQDEDGRYRKTFKEGRELLANAIDTCRDAAPVHVVIVPGNHDEERAFYLGDALECYYMRDKHVEVDNGPAEHKVVRIGKSLIGLTHGDKASVNSLPLLLATNWKEEWAKTEYRCWHLGHLHTDRKKTFSPSSTQDGVHIRWLPSLCPSSSWAAGKGYIPYRQGIGILWAGDGPVGEIIHRP